MRMRKNLVRNDKAKVDCDILKAVSLGHFVGIGQGVCHAPWSQTMRRANITQNVQWSQVDAGWGGQLVATPKCH